MPEHQSFSSLQMGESHLLIQGKAGQLECIVQRQPEAKGIGIVCHPHPLHHGTMKNKVVHTVARAFHNKGIDVVRFNFRGVGKSAGQFGDSVGEIEDLQTVIQWLQTTANLNFLSLYLAGFSFGAYIAAQGATQSSCKQLFSIAPAVTNQPYQTLGKIECPWLVVQADQDEVISAQAVYDWFEMRKQQQSDMKLIRLSEASHFFHGKLIYLRQQIENNLLI